MIFETFIIALLMVIAIALLLLEIFMLRGLRWRESADCSLLRVD